MAKKKAAKAKRAKGHSVHMAEHAPKGKEKRRWELILIVLLMLAVLACVFALLKVEGKV